MRSVLLLSGGLDSAVLLAWAVGVERDRPHCLAFNYDQRHSRELESSRKIAAHYGATWFRVDLPGTLFWGSALTGGPDVPHAHYNDPSQVATVVPNRNMVMLSIAGSVAVQIGAERVLFAAHAGDADIYPDCRHQFVGELSRAMRLGCGVAVEAPFLARNKKDIVRLGRELAVPFDMTWSCYEGGNVPCGECGACVERREALGE